jgi:hypothetical protein
LPGLTVNNEAAHISDAEVTQLPPLILHPFSGGCGPEDLLEGSRASLALQGLLESTEEEPSLQRKMLNGRYHEVRMLLFLGKDIFRWLQQCAEQVRGQASRPGSNQEADSRISEQSFAALLVEEPPAGVKSKLESWGVTDRRAIFSRAIGIHSLFQDPPPAESLSPVFLKNYHRYADHAYICYLHTQSFHALDAKRFHWEIYASEEYARLLSEQWEDKN